MLKGEVLTAMNTNGLLLKARLSRLGTWTSFISLDYLMIFMIIRGRSRSFWEVIEALQG